MSKGTVKALSDLETLQAAIERAREAIGERDILPAKPSGWFTVIEYARGTGRNAGTVRGLLAREVAKGKPEAGFAYAEGSDHRVTPQRIYRAKP